MLESARDFAGALLKRYYAVDMRSPFTGMVEMIEQRDAAIRAHCEQLDPTPEPTGKSK
jgi:hypothetical protein